MTTSHNKIKVIFVLNLLLFAVVAVRVVYVNVVHGKKLLEQRERQTRRLIKLDAARGRIFDCDGEVMALDVPVKSAFGDPKEIKDPAKTAKILAGLLHLNEKTLRDRFARKSLSFVWIKQRLDEAEEKAVTRANLKGVGLRDETRRVYPSGRVGANLIGFTGGAGEGEGVELVYDSYLRGKEGKVALEKDGLNRNIPGTVRERIPARNGDDIRLTIDLALQHFAERELEAAVEAHGARGGSVLVLDPSTGRIYAMASHPSFDPNEFWKQDAASYRNKPLGYVFEPGSTFKSVLAASALDAGLLGPDDVKFQCRGQIRVGKHTISDSHVINGGHGAISLYGVLEHSCNVGASQLGMMMGEKRLRKYVRIFGFGARTGFGLNGEEPGILPAPNRWGDIHSATVSFGQGISVTPIQAAMAYAALANGGWLMKPWVVDEVKREDGQTRFKGGPVQVRRAVSERAAAQVKEMLWLAVSSGTGKKAQIPHYSVAGKTGTAQAVKDGRYEPGKYIASFVGFTPVENPKVLTYVVIEEPSGAYYGGEVAGPVFQKITQQALWRLNVPPTDEASVLAGPELEDKG